jgi:hypothetical protein
VATDKEIRITLRCEDEWNVARLVADDGPIELARIRTTILEKHPEAVQPWKDLVTLVSRAVIEAAIAPHGGTVRGFIERRPGEPTTPPEERN